MKKSITYFNFGLLLTALVVAIQIVLWIILQLFKCQTSEFLFLGLPPVLAIISGLIWYYQEKVFLKIEQYLIAIMPALYFFSSGLVYALKDRFQLVVFNTFIAIFVTTWIAQQWAILSLAGNFNEINFVNKLHFKSLIYLSGCSSIMWFFTYWLFL